MAHLFPSGMITDIITGARNGRKKQTLKIRLNSLFHVFKVWGNEKLVTHRWAAFFSEAQNTKGFRRVWAALQTFLSLGSYDPEDPVEHLLVLPSQQSWSRENGNNPTQDQQGLRSCRNGDLGHPKWKSQFSEGHTECTREGGSWNDHRGPYDQL